MKKYFLLLLFTAISYAQTNGVTKLKITANPEKTAATRVVVQDAATGEVGYVNKTTIVTLDATTTTTGKIQLAGDLGGTATDPTVPALLTKEPTIASGTTSQYYRGDKTWQTLDKTAVGLSNVDNTSDLNKPISTATQTALNAKENTANKNTANGYAGLGSDGKLISNQLPAITITDTFVVGSQAAMLALTAETGDVAVRTDLSKSYILKGSNPSVLADWQELLSPVDGVTSVFGRVGSVVANTGDYTTAQVTETTNKKYQTDAQALYNDATSSIQTQLNSKANDSNVVHKTGDETVAGVKTFSNLTNFSTYGIKINTNGWVTPNQVYGETGNFFVNYSGNGNTIIGNSTGKVGIGTTSPSGILHINAGALADTNIRVQSGASGNHAKLTFSNSLNDVFWTAGYRSGTGDFGINYGDSFNSTGITINTSGNVGIGTTSPTTKLDVAGTGRFITGLTVDSGTTPFLYFSSARTSGNSGHIKDDGNMSFVKTEAGGGFKWFNNSTALMHLDSGANLGVGIVNPSAKLEVQNGVLGASIKVSNSGGGYASLDVSSNASSVASLNFTNSLSLNGGNVGIGNANPAYKLSIIPPSTYGNAEDGNININSAPSGGTVSSPTTVGGIVFGDQNVTNGYSGRIAVIQDNPSASTSSHMRFYTNAGGGNTITSERMRITSNGNVGIGTTAPINGGNAAKWITTEGTTNYSGGLVASINGNAKAYFYSQDNYAIVQGASGQGVKLMPNGVDGLTMNSSGNVGIGVAPDAGRLKVQGVTSIGQFTNGTATIDAFGGIAYYCNSDTSHAMGIYNNGNYFFTGSNVSDIRAKENIKDLTFNATEKVMSLQPKSYFMKNDSKKLRYGFIAQEVNEILPDLINGDPKGKDFIGLDYNGIIPVLVKAIQEQQVQIKELQKEVEILKNK